ncbi:hypothetical protein [Vagococcus fluvialis]|uniref:hypothetical protein n=1 Tax=Vagococcus fluvialis TaxID=2738 RepID=UPI0020337B6B|nr:hypothetical protein [Vagococcus fluvialis]MCM2139499.1 hypothetical protein [Vagococcus fluvialis]
MKKIFGLLSIMFLTIFILGGCSSKSNSINIKSFLTDGSEKWSMTSSTDPNINPKIIFQSSEQATFLIGTKSFEVAYEVNEDKSEITFISEYFTNIYANTTIKLTDVEIVDKDTIVATGKYDSNTSDSVRLTRINN